jgi:catechol 2,3-dioxygenase-like lactoylglutathione lyase family enzyme
MKLPVALAAAGLLLSRLAAAQAPTPAAAPPSAVTIGFMHAIHATNEVEKTLAFYRDVFGVSAQVRDFANQAVPILTNSPGVTLKVSMLNLPGQGFNFELTQFSNVERHAAQPQIWDPGAPHMKFLVRDLEPVVAAVKRAGTPILSKSGAPVALKRPDGEVKAIYFRDPDGYIVEAIQAPAWARSWA